MLHIAICEDEELYLKAIQEHLQELAASERYEIFDIHPVSYTHLTLPTTSRV